MIFLLVALLSLLSIQAKKSDVLKFTEPRQIISHLKKYLPENPIILEAGAYDGLDTLNLLNHWPQAHIFSFEAVPAIFKSFEKNIKNEQRITGFNLALSDRSGKQKMYVSSHASSPTVPSQSSSLLKPKDHLLYAPSVLFKSEIDVDCVTIDEWAHAVGVDKIDLMWLDLQGSELEVLKASPTILKTVKVIITEVEFVEAYKGQALYAEIKRWLESQGFTEIAFSDTYGWFGDAVFVRL